MTVPTWLWLFDRDVKHQIKQNLDRGLVNLFAQLLTNCCLGAPFNRFFDKQWTTRWHDVHTSHKLHVDRSIYYPASGFKALTFNFGAFFHMMIKLQTLWIQIRPDKCQASSGSKLFDTLTVFLSKKKCKKGSNFTICLLLYLTYPFSSYNEYGSAVVECLTQDQGAADSSLTSVTALCPWARHINPSLVLVQYRKTRPFITERLLMGCKESNQTNKITLTINDNE